MKFCKVSRFSGRPFSYFPNYCKHYKISVSACVFFCRIDWDAWDENDGWVVSNVDKITEITGLTRREQEGARKELVAAGMIQEHYARLEHALKFRVDPDLEMKEEDLCVCQNEEGGAPQENENGQTRKTPLGKREERLSSNKGITIKEEEGNAALSGSVEKVVMEWNKTTRLPKCLAASDKRKAQLRSRLRDQFFAANWEAALRKCGASDFCAGQNDRGWKATLDWFLQPDSVVKIMEGKYDSAKPKKRDIPDHIKQGYVPDAVCKSDPPEHRDPDTFFETVRTNPK